MDMKFQRKYFFESLMNYIKTPCTENYLNLIGKQMIMEHYLQQEEIERENRIVDKVLERLSVRIDKDGALADIKSLRDELQKLYQMFE